MALLNWTEENSVGVIEIDLQHQKLFVMINRLSDLLNQPESKEEMNGVLTELINYANYHFQTEEKYFEEFGYEGKEEHKLQHKRYREAVAGLINTNRVGNEPEISLKVLDFLEGWWMNHINGEDKKYTECFRSHGLK